MCITVYIYIYIYIYISDGVNYCLSLSYFDTQAQSKDWGASAISLKHRN